MHIKKLSVSILCIFMLGPLLGAKTPPKYITYLASSANQYKFCNGANMGSDGYRKTINQVKKTDISTKGMSRQEILNQTIFAASGPDNNVTNCFKEVPNCFGRHNKLITLRGDTAYIAPIDGWAGVSIFMCAWRPLVNVNLQRSPFVKHIVWQGDW